ncbi:phosphatase PAP2 family protein [Methylobacterium sp. WL9]|uniref:phosphatase PAP2 family protein n=1 Tax=Methylobacterium sp. WL9 TaxID=2603898 RepID=UPI001FEEBA15|nr:phosphatase PAP2 family protein [Methylobacterium sp. WL9]
MTLLVIDAVWLAVVGIRLEGPGFPITALCVSGLLVAAAILGPVKSEPKLRAMALSAACLVAFTVAVGIFHYLTATLSLPLADRWLAAVERGLGFDWTAYIGFLATHPALSWWLALAYHSSGPQIAVVVIVLSATSHLGRLWAFVRLYVVLLMSAVLISAVMPAVGPYAFYQPHNVPADHIETVGALWHLEPLAKLRDGTLKVIALGDIRGLVTFPSFHVCLAAITAWALAPVPLLGPLVVLLNAAVVVSAIGSGGHYLPDILAGGVLAALALSSRGRVKRGWLSIWAVRPAIKRRVWEFDRGRSLGGAADVPTLHNGTG